MTAVPVPAAPEVDVEPAAFELEPGFAGAAAEAGAPEPAEEPAAPEPELPELGARALEGGALAGVPPDGPRGDAMAARIADVLIGVVVLAGASTVDAATAPAAAAAAVLVSSGDCEHARLSVVKLSRLNMLLLMYGPVAGKLGVGSCSGRPGTQPPATEALAPQRSSMRATRTWARLVFADARSGLARCIAAARSCSRGPLTARGLGPASRALGLGAWAWAWVWARARASAWAPARARDIVALCGEAALLAGGEWLRVGAIS